MREAFEKEDYEKLLSLAKESRSSEASFYLGIIAENGLLGDVDLDKAEQYYLKAFHNGDGLIKAGINLARVYQKHYKISDAENIYNQIISLSKSADNISLEYAKYKLARIDAKELLEDDSVNADKVQKIIDTYSNFIKNSSFKDNSPIKVKAKYHKALIELKWAYDIIKSDTLLDEDSFKDKYFEEALSLPENNSLRQKYEGIKIKIQELDEEDGSLLNQWGGVDLSEEKEALFKELYDIKIGFLQKHSKIINKKLDKLKQEVIKNQMEWSGVNEVKVELEKISEEYAPAAAELFNIEARDFLQKQRYADVIKLTKEALSKDPNNINSMLIQVDYYLMHRQGKETDKDKKNAFELIRKILKIDPTNQLAVKKSNLLKHDLAKEISEGIIQDLKDKTAKLDGFYVWKSSRESYIEEFSPFIKNYLENSEYIEKYASFDNKTKIIENLSRKILEKSKNKQYSIEENIKNSTFTIFAPVKSNIERKISEWNEKKVAQSHNSLSVQENELLDKRQAFKEAVMHNLGDYYKRCYALTQEGSDVTIKDLEGLWGSVGDITQISGSFLAAVTGSIVPAVIGTAAKGVSECAETARKAALIEAARKFSEIGGRKDKETLEAFERIANQLVERYGMQIDNIKGDSIKDLAKVGTEKMLHQVREITIAGELSKIAGKPLKTIEGLVKYYGGMDNQSNKTTEEMLIQGVIEGKAKDKNRVEIRTEDARGGDWEASEVFELPAITSDGKIFYARIDSQGLFDYLRGASKKLVENAAKYGAMYIPEDQINDSYRQMPTDGNKAVSGNNKTIIEKELEQHFDLIDNSVWISSVHDIKVNISYSPSNLASAA